MNSTCGALSVRSGYPLVIWRRWVGRSRCVELRTIVTFLPQIAGTHPPNVALPSARRDDTRHGEQAVLREGAQGGSRWGFTGPPRRASAAPLGPFVGAQKYY